MRSFQRGLVRATTRILQHGMNDLNEADLVEVRISPDGTKVWIDVDGINRFRVYNAKRVVVHDDR